MKSEERCYERNIIKKKKIIIPVCKRRDEVKRERKKLRDGEKIYERQRNMRGNE